MQGIGSTMWRRLCGTAVCSVVLLLVSPVAARAEPNVPVPPNELISDDGEGALSAADKDLVVKVRLAGLWEIPAGEMAQRKSQDPRIRKIGREIAAQHEVLDAFDRAAAKKLKITLPNKPNSDQQGWLAEMRDAEGAEFDEIYIDRLRAVHGKIAAPPTAPNPAAAGGASAAVARPVPAADERRLPSTNLPVALLTLAAGLAVGIVATMRFAGNRRRPYRRSW